MSKLIVLLIRTYQIAISPLFPPSCRYVPSCSRYAIEAVSRYGVLRGVYLAARRLLRCHPFAAGGFDPVDQNGIFTSDHPMKKTSTYT